MNRRRFLTSTAAVSALPLAGAMPAQAATLPLSAPVHVGSSALYCRDAEALARWYARHVGLTEISRDGDTIRMGVNRTPLLDLQQQSGVTLAPQTQAGLFHNAFLLPSRAALGNWIYAAMEGDFAVDGVADHLVSEAIYLTDPEGNGVEIYADRPAPLWSWEDGQIAMATDPLDIDGILAVPGAMPGNWQGAPDGTCLGHVHLKVGNMERASSWWQEVMGFDAVRQRRGAAFLSTGGYHHHIAVNEWMSAGAGHRKDNMTGLAHVELRSTLVSEPQTFEDDWGTTIRVIPV
ncbi:VOC family protein [Pseudooceanicola sp. C21-150M6]|uniref:VOC family protein n=1 Tax=Pseudooceanicola sp. C21-150M6 TaxID=3434355 RepID=UPI003D7F5AC8